MRSITYLHVRARSASSTTGRLTIGQTTVTCRLGRSGRAQRKREGDGASPIGIWQLEQVYFRDGRLPRPRTGLAVRASRKTDAWCEDPADGRYNRKITVRPGEGNENFWRVDGAYDVVIPTRHNSRPRVKGGGSAIFFHLTRAGSTVTAGCIAIARRDMEKILARCGPVTFLVIWPPEGGPPGALRRSPSPPARRSLPRQ